MFDSSLKVNETSNYSVQSKQAVIIGAGISGLYAAIRLQNLGYEVTILEKRSELGGACGSVSFEGENYELANQIGVSAIKLLETAGIKFGVTRVVNEMHFVDDTMLKTPFDLKSIWNLLYPYSIYNIIQSIRRSESKRLLSDLSTELSPRFSNLLQGMFAYPSSNPAIKIGQLQQILKDEGGYSTPSVPSEGMPSVINQMMKIILSKGGKIYCNKECIDIAHSKTKHLIKTREQEYTADIVFSSAHAWQKYPSNSLSGLNITTLFLNMDDRFQYPENTHTIAFMPNNISEWFNVLDSNDIPPAFPSDFGFHCFKNRLKDSSNLTIFIPTPRQMKGFSLGDKERIKLSVIEKLKKRLPNLESSIRSTHIFTPSEFNNEFGLSMQVPQLILTETYTPNQINDEKGIYLIGDSVSPLNPNIYGAIASVDHLIATLAFTHRLEQQIPSSFNYTH